jgi:hypothetical protein
VFRFDFTYKPTNRGLFLLKAGHGREAFIAAIGRSYNRLVRGGHRQAAGR